MLCNLYHRIILWLIYICQGQDAAYVQALNEFYVPYHLFVDFMVRVAVNKNCLSDKLVNLSELSFLYRYLLVLHLL